MEVALGSSAGTMEAVGRPQRSRGKGWFQGPGVGLGGPGKISWKLSQFLGTTAGPAASAFQKILQSQVPALT